MNLILINRRCTFMKTFLWNYITIAWIEVVLWSSWKGIFQLFFFLSFCPFTSLISTHRVFSAPTSTWDRLVCRLLFHLDRTETCAGCYFISRWLEFIQHIYCLETFCFSVHDFTFIFGVDFFFLVLKKKKSPKICGREETLSLWRKRTSVRFLVPHCGCLKIWCFLIFGFFGQVASAGNI